MKKRAALAVCGIIAASFAATALSNKLVQADTKTQTENSSERATLQLSPELAAKKAAAADEAATDKTEAAKEASDKEKKSEEISRETEEKADTADTEADETSTEAGTADTEADEEADDSDSEDDAEAVVESTDYLVISLPGEWKDHYEMKEGDKVEGIPTISFYEKTAYDNDESGLLFSLYLTTNREDYLAREDEECIGNLIADDGTSYAVVARFPADSESSEAAKERYEQMTADVPIVLKSLAAKEGMTFHYGQTRQERSAEESYVFAQILEEFRKSGKLPNGTTIDITAATSETNQFAVLDADGDGANELIMKIGSPAASDKTTQAAEKEETAADTAESANADITDKAEADEAATDAAADGESDADTAASDATDTDAAGAESAEADAVDTETTESTTTDTDATISSTSDTATEEDAAEEDTAQADTAEADNAQADITRESTDIVISADVPDGEDWSEEEYYDDYAASNYYIFKGDPSVDSHAAHLSADGLADALVNTSEEYVTTAYDIDWLNITKGETAKLSGVARVPVGESAAHIDAKRRHAFRKALNTILTDNEMPDGSQATSYVDYTDEDMEENSFAITDVDADGEDELIIQIDNTGMDTMQEQVYGYDADEDELQLEFTGVPGGVTYYDNGTLKSEAAFDNNDPSAMWPFSLLAFDEEKGSYEEKGSVSAMDETVVSKESGRTVDILGQGFDSAIDEDGNGRIYYLDDEDADEKAEPVDDDQLLAWADRIVGMNSGSIYMDWSSLTEDNIDSALAKW